MVGRSAHSSGSVKLKRCSCCPAVTMIGAPAFCASYSMPIALPRPGAACRFTQANRPESHTFLFRCVYVLVGTFAFAVITYVITLAESARWHWPFVVWAKIIFASLLNLLLTPIVFYVLGLPPRLAGYRPAYEQKGRGYAR